MQTFLPYSDFLESADTIDYKAHSRLWKQVLEAKQLLVILQKMEERSINNTNEKIGYENHPAIKMWLGYNELLTHYINSFIKVYNVKANKDLKLLPVTINNIDEVEKPWWFGNKYFHDSHKARLLSKNLDYYSDYFNKDKYSKFNNGEYFWCYSNVPNVFNVIITDKPRMLKYKEWFNMNPMTIKYIENKSGCKIIIKK